MAYSTREAGQPRNTVYVQPFPAAGTTYQISKNTEDGHHPVWSPDGKELFYIPGPGGQLAAARITTDPSFTFGNAEPVPERFDNYPPAVAARNYDMGPDGKFVGLSSGQFQAGTATAPQINVVLNWTEELKRLVPTR